ncbi:MAG TPA: hypothetical protein VGM21_16045 [Actinomycetota bacterium]|jgi:hypothetical protein
MHRFLAAHAAAHTTTTHAASNAAHQAAQAARDLHLPLDNDAVMLLLAVAIGWAIAAILRGMFGR